MRKSVRPLGLVLCIATLLVCSVAWGGEALIATVTGDNVNLRLSPSIKGKKNDEKASRDEIYIVDSKLISQHSQ